MLGYKGEIYNKVGSVKTQKKINIVETLKEHFLEWSRG